MVNKNNQRQKGESLGARLLRCNAEGSTMARKNKFTPYGEEIVETFDEDAGSSEFLSYQFGRSSHTNDDFFPDDPVPLFLSGQVEESKRPALRKTKDKRIMSSLPLKTTVLVASAAVIVFSVLAVENPL